MSLVVSLSLVFTVIAEEPAKVATKKVEIGSQAPVFKIKDASGKEINLADLTANGAVLVRLTCGCYKFFSRLFYLSRINKSYRESFTQLKT